MRDGGLRDVSVALGLRPFAGLRYTGDADVVRERTMTPPDTWVGAAPLRPDDAHHVARLLEPTFAGTGGGPRLDVWERDGAVSRDRPAVYAYRRTGPDGATRGLLGAMDLSGRTSAPLVPHEDVRPDLVVVQERFLDHTHAQVDPVVAVAGSDRDGRSSLAAALDHLTEQAPTLELGEGDDLHQLWVHESDHAHRLVADVAVGPVLVADGHHRLRAWSAQSGGVRPWGLVWVVDEAVEPLQLRAVHRVCPGLSLATIEASPLVVSTPLDPDAARALLAAADGPVCVAYRDSRWLGLTPAAGATAPGCALPDHAVCWLHDGWLAPWGVDPSGVQHVHGIDAAVHRADDLGASALLLPPAPIADVRAAAEAGLVLPAKATSFVPKPRMGLVMRHWGSPGDDVLAPAPAGTGRPRRPRD
ncbi:MAG: DUF1015 family protein [Nocardioidaceae bacterium]|nr:DUF1015 family protein [Nocardioidaceae bacterium]